MRKILFRGKRIDNGEWIYGDVVQFPTHGIVRIVEQEPSYKDAEVDSETVGQYTGMTDKNGKKIFEGDIVKLPHDTKSMNGKIEYIEEDCIYYLTYKTSRVPFGVFFNGFELEIIGNIHENPELLEVTK